MTAPFESKAINFLLNNNCLQVGGWSIDRLAERVGSTPFFAYDRSLIESRVREVRTALPRDILLHYAVKANPMPAVVQMLAGLVDGFDVASVGELKTVLDAPVAPDRISLAGPGKTERHLRQAVASGIVVNLESEREMELLAQIGDLFGVIPKAAIRVNPDFDTKRSGMKMGGGPKQFGVDAERVPAMLARMGKLPLEFMGFQIFWGSQNLRAEFVVEAHKRTFQLARRLAENVPSPIKLLNLGGGFGIPYFQQDTPLDLVAVGRNLAEMLATEREAFPCAQFVVELGRFLVGEAGVYVCRVIERKVSHGQVYLVTDGGMHHHLAASGNLGQPIRRNYPVLVGNRVHVADSSPASVVGPLCTPLDILADKMPLGHAREGDLIVVLQSGAYGLTASPTAFLSHPQPAEILV